MARRFNVRTRAPRRLTRWAVTQIESPVTVAANAAVLLASLNAAALALLPFTIVRMRGMIFCSTDQATALEDYGGVFAQVHTTQRATAAGIGSIDNPISDGDSGNFIMYEPVYGKAFITATGATQTQVAFPYDSKAMRKLEVEDDLAIVFESFPDFGVDVAIVGRFLIKLH